MLWWYWAIIGFGFLLAELLVPAFVLVWFGLSGLLIMVAVLLMPALILSYQIFGWTVLSILMVVAWFRILHPGGHKTLIGRASAQFIGEVGLLVEAIEPFKPGKVRFQKPLIGSDLWSCFADEAIAAGTRVKVVRVDGTSLTVTKTESKP